uniref:Uncharacterized protein n=1 Tax=Lutzomyia longipalpis TaxID=7200 RepID=A0A1B0CRX3_LUTLO
MSSGFDAVQKYVIGGVDTDFVVHKFNEKLLVLITQFGKITNILTVSNERDFESDLFQKKNVNKHLGKYINFRENSSISQHFPQQINTNCVKNVFWLRRGAEIRHWRSGHGFCGAQIQRETFRPDHAIWKITNILTVSNERDFESDLFQKYNKHLNVQNKFGKDEDEVQAAVRRIFTQVECKGIQSYVVSLGIREINKDSLGEIVEILKQILSRGVEVLAVIKGRSSIWPLVVFSHVFRWNLGVCGATGRLLGAWVIGKISEHNLSGLVVVFWTRLNFAE